MKLQMPVVGPKEWEKVPGTQNVIGKSGLNFLCLVQVGMLKHSKHPAGSANDRTRPAAFLFQFRIRIRIVDRWESCSCSYTKHHIVDKSNRFKFPQRSESKKTDVFFINSLIYHESKLKCCEKHFAWRRQPHMVSGVLLEKIMNMSEDLLVWNATTVILRWISSIILPLLVCTVLFSLCEVY